MANSQNLTRGRGDRKTKATTQERNFEKKKLLFVKEGKEIKVFMKERWHENEMLCLGKTAKRQNPRKKQQENKSGN